MDSIQADVKNKRLTDAYYTSCFHASRLRVKLTTRNRISKATFKEFKSAFDYLFQISSNRKEFKNSGSLIDDISNWLMIKTSHVERDYVVSGLMLFYKYQKAMNDLNLINDSQ